MAEGDRVQNRGKEQLQETIFRGTYPFRASGKQPMWSIVFLEEQKLVLE